MEEQYEEDKKSYEFSYLISSLLSAEEALSFLEKIKGVFLSVGGEITKEPTLEKRSLVYSIKKQETAYFGYFQVIFIPEKANEIKDKFHYEKDLLRYLLITPPPSSKREARQSFDGDQKLRTSKEEITTVENKDDSVSLPEEKSEVDVNALEHTLEEIEKIS